MWVGSIEIMLPEKEKFLNLREIKLEELLLTPSGASYDIERRINDFYVLKKRIFSTVEWEAVMLLPITEKIGAAVYVRGGYMSKNITSKYILGYAVGQKNNAYESNFGFERKEGIEEKITKKMYKMIEVIVKNREKIFEQQGQKELSHMLAEIARP